MQGSRQPPASPCFLNAASWKTADPRSRFPSALGCLPPLCRGHVDVFLVLYVQVILLQSPQKNVHVMLSAGKFSTQLWLTQLPLVQAAPPLASSLWLSPCPTVTAQVWCSQATLGALAREHQSFHPYSVAITTAGLKLHNGTTRMWRHPHHRKDKAAEPLGLSDKTVFFGLS